MAGRTGSLKARRPVLTSLKPAAFRLPLNPIITKDPYGTQQRITQHLNLHQRHHRRHGLGNRRHFGGEAVDAIQRNDFGRYVFVFLHRLFAGGYRLSGAKTQRTALLRPLGAAGGMAVFAVAAAGGRRSVCVAVCRSVKGILVSRK